jgi:hypothetical protein
MKKFAFVEKSYFMKTARFNEKFRFYENSLL